MSGIDEDAFELAEALNEYDERLDCGDNSCLFASHKGGMRTNGGCRCVDRPGVKSALALIVKLSRKVAAHCPNRRVDA